MIKKLLFLIVLFSFNTIYSQLTVTTNTSNPLCFGESGDITVNVSGGTAPYMLSMAPVVMFPQEINPNTFVFNGLPSGTYTIVVTDSNNTTQTVNAAITSPSPLNLTHTMSGFQITASATGGSAPYAYILTDLTNGTAPVSQSSGVFNIVEPGFYDLAVTDAAGCFDTIRNINVSGIDLLVQDEYDDYNRDGFLNAGDVINYRFSVTNNGISPMTDVNIFANQTAMSGGPIAVLIPGATDTTTFTGRHIITEYDINNRGLNDDFLAFATYNNFTVYKSKNVNTSFSISDGIRLNVFADRNNNGTQDAGEYNVDAGAFNYQVDGGSVVWVSPYTGGYTIYGTNPASVYTISYVIRPEMASRYTINNAVYNNVTIPANSGITTLNFPLTELPYTDLSVNVIPYGPPPRPGFTYNNLIAYRNNGTSMIANGILTFNHDAAVSIIDVSETGTVPVTNGFTYAFTSLMPNETRYIIVGMQVPTIPTVSLGQMVTNTAAITGAAGDMNAQNNSDSITQVIVGSYDPNDKTEAHGGKILHSSFTTNDYLTYTIRFENTGTYEAVNVRVNDVLDSKLDETTVQTIRTSHPYVLERKDNELNWKFDAIGLRPSVPNTNIGHGYITFKVKPKAGYAIGDIIPNTASIYFDFNPAIVTDVCNTEFVNTLSTDAFGKNAFVLYPNPTNGIVNIALKDASVSATSAEVMDVSGKVLFKKTVTNPNAAVDLTSLANGMYFIKLKAGQQEQTVKVVKQ